MCASILARDVLRAPRATAWWRSRPARPRRSACTPHRVMPRVAKLDHDRYLSDCPDAVGAGALDGAPRDRDIGGREAAVPEHDPLAVARPAPACARRRSAPSSAWSDSSVRRPARTCGRSAPNRVVTAALPPVVDDDLVERVEHVELERRSSCRTESGGCTARATPFAGSAPGARAASPRRRCPRRPTVSSIVSSTRTGLPSASSSRLPKARRDSSRLLVTRISAKSKRRVEHRHVRERGAAGAEMGEHPRAGPAELRAPSAVSAPVRRSVISVPSTIAIGTPVRGS